MATVHFGKRDRDEGNRLMKFAEEAKGQPFCPNCGHVFEVGFFGKPKGSCYCNSMSSRS